MLPEFSEETPDKIGGVDLNGGLRYQGLEYPKAATGCLVYLMRLESRGSSEFGWYHADTISRPDGMRDFLFL